MRQLHAQLQNFTNQRDILKKAVGIFAGPNGSVSPWPRLLKTFAPNRFGQWQAAMKRSYEVWTADITYMPTAEGWLYLAGVLDLGSRWLVGWATDANLETGLPMDALRMALG